MNLKDPKPCVFQHRCWNISLAENGNCGVEMDDVFECFVDVEDMGYMSKCHFPQSDRNRAFDLPKWDENYPCRSCEDKPCLEEVILAWEKRTGKKYGEKNENLEDDVNRNRKGENGLR